jgi:hypothetical protein
MPNASPNKHSTKSSFASKPPLISHEKAKESATKVYEHSADLEVLLRHKVYPKTVGEINGAQVRLNRVRTHVAGSLKKKELHKVKWLGLPKSRWGEGFVVGFILGITFMAIMLAFWTSSYKE